MFKITVVEFTPPREVTATEVSITPHEIERFSQTVDTIDIKRVIDAVNPSTRKAYKKRGKEATS